MDKIEKMLVYIEQNNTPEKFEALLGPHAVSILISLVRVYREANQTLLEHIERPIQYQEREHARKDARAAEEKANRIVAK